MSEYKLDNEVKEYESIINFIGSYFRDKDYHYVIAREPVINEKLKERSNYNLSQETKVVSKVVSNKYSVNNDDLKDGAFYRFFAIISIYLNLLLLISMCS